MINTVQKCETRTATTNRAKQVVVVAFSPASQKSYSTPKS